jgi:hypothetical protein
MGGCGLQKVRPRCAPSTLVSMRAPAGPLRSGWLVQICLNRVHLANGLPACAVAQWGRHPHSRQGTPGGRKASAQEQEGD